MNSLLNSAISTIINLFSRVFALPVVLHRAGRSDRLPLGEWNGSGGEAWAAAYFRESGGPGIPGKGPTRAVMARPIPVIGGAIGRVATFDGGPGGILDTVIDN